MDKEASYHLINPGFRLNCNYRRFLGPGRSPEVRELQQIYKPTATQRLHGGLESPGGVPESFPSATLSFPDNHSALFLSAKIRDPHGTMPRAFCGPLGPVPVSRSELCCRRCAASGSEAADWSGSFRCYPSICRPVGRPGA